MSAPLSKVRREQIAAEIVKAITYLAGNIAEVQDIDRQGGGQYTSRAKSVAQIEKFSTKLRAHLVELSGPEDEK